MLCYLFFCRSVLFVVGLVLVLYVRCQTVEEHTTTLVQWLLGHIRSVLHDVHLRHLRWPND